MADCDCCSLLSGVLPRGATPKIGCMNVSWLVEFTFCWFISNDGDMLSCCCCWDWSEFCWLKLEGTMSPLLLKLCCCCSTDRAAGMLSFCCDNKAARAAVALFVWSPVWFESFESECCCCCCREANRLAIGKSPGAVAAAESSCCRLTLAWLWAVFVGEWESFESGFWPPRRIAFSAIDLSVFSCVCAFDTSASLNCVWKKNIKKKLFN